MKNKKYLNILMTASLALSFITPNIYTIEPDPFELTKEQKTEIQETISLEIDKQIQSAITQMQKIDSTLEELAQIIQNGLVKTKNKTRLILQIKALRQFITQISNNPFSEADLSTVNFLLTINKCLINHIQKAIKGGLKNIQDIDPQEIIPKTKVTSFEQLEVKLIKNEKSYNKLEKSVQTVGLSWINIIYRKLFVAPYKTAKKHHIPTITKWSLIGGIITGYIYYRFTNVFEKRLGQAPIINQYGNLTNEDELKKLGKIEYNLYAAINMPITKLLITVAPFLFYKDLKKLTIWTQKKLEILHRKLIGGIQSKNNRQKYDFSSPRYTFKDVVGLEHVKKELKPLVEYIKNCARFERVGIGPEKGYLFAGKPGTGKSFMAEALAGQIAQALSESGAAEDTFSFIPFEASEIYEIITEKGVSDGIDAIMNFAKEHAPCIVFIDEPDLLGLQRTANRELLSKLLNAMNGFLSNNISENVILLAATNRPDNLDPALLRRGRLGKIIHFEYPSYESRKNYLIKKLNPIVADLQEFNLEKISRETEGSTFEALQSMIRKAFQDTKIRGTSLTQKDLLEAMNQEIRQILPETRKISDKEMSIIAAQQASTAFTNILLDPTDKLSCVTIQPVMKTIRESNVWDRYYEKEDSIIQQGKTFTYKAGDTSGIYSKEDLLANCTIALAGDIGQEILLGSCGYGYNKTGKNKALSIALLIASEGLDLKEMPKKLKQEYYKKALEIMQTCKEKARKLLEENKTSLEKIHNALLEHKILEAKDIIEIIKPKEN